MGKNSQQALLFIDRKRRFSETGTARAVIPAWPAWGSFRRSVVTATARHFASPLGRFALAGFLALAALGGLATSHPSMARAPQVVASPAAITGELA
jgi:hypothetical protein